MRWDDFRRSENVEDAGGGGGFGGGFKIGGGALIAIVVISLLLGKNPLDVLTLLETGTPPTAQAPAGAPPHAVLCATLIALLIFGHLLVPRP